jgi:hypothetical protein
MFRIPNLLSSLREERQALTSVTGPHWTLARSKTAQQRRCFLPSTWRWQLILFTKRRVFYLLRIPDNGQKQFTQWFCVFKVFIFLSMLHKRSWKSQLVANRSSRPVLFQDIPQYLYYVYIELFSVCRLDSLFETKLHWPRSCTRIVEESDIKWSVRKLLRLGKRERERGRRKQERALNILKLQVPDEITFGIFRSWRLNVSLQDFDSGV